MERNHLPFHHFGRKERHLFGALADIVPCVGVERAGGSRRPQSVGDIALGADALVNLTKAFRLDDIAVGCHDGRAARRSRNQQSEGEQFDRGRSGHDSRLSWYGVGGAEAQ